MDNKGFTLIEMVVSVAVISLVIVFAVTIYTATIHSSRVDEERLIVLSHNISVLEQLKEMYYSTGDNGVLLREYEFSEELFGNGVLYETYVNTKRIIFTDDEDMYDDIDYEDDIIIVGDEKHKLAFGSSDLAWRSGSSSELYRVDVETRVRGRKVPGTEVVAYLSWRGSRE